MSCDGFDWKAGFDEMRESESLLGWLPIVVHGGRFKLHGADSLSTSTIDGSEGIGATYDKLMCLASCDVQESPSQDLID